MSTIQEIRDFSLFFSRTITYLRECVIDTPYSLVEAEIIYVLGHGPNLTVRALAGELNRDPSAVARAAKALEVDGLVRRQTMEEHARRHALSLTSDGQDAFAQINVASERQIRLMLAHLGPVEEERLVEAMQTVRSLLAGAG